MPYEFKFPDVGEGIHEGHIVKWFVKEGDAIENDQALGQIETDKALVEIPSPKAGKILRLHAPAGATIKVGEVMVTILEKGEKPGKLSSDKGGAGNAMETKVEEKYTGSVVGFLEEAKSVTPIQQHGESASQGREILATPAVRSLARQLKVDLSSVRGTGSLGKITIEDVQKFSKGVSSSSQASSSAPVASSGLKIQRKYDFFGYIDRQKLSGIRKVVSEKMSESIFTAAQITNFYEVDSSKLVELREKDKKKYGKQKIKITYMPYLVKAVASCLQKHPYLNSSLEGDEIIFKKYYNIGVAVDTDEGLMVPVVKGAEKKDIPTLAKEIETMAEQARNRKVNLMDLKGGTFTISNIGSVGGTLFTPILNYPESAILGVGKITEKAVVKSGKVTTGKVLPLSLTYDHRTIDGATASRFMNDVIAMLEQAKF